MPFNQAPQILEQRENFGLREVGLTHPDVGSFVKLTDNGDIEIVATEGLAIIMHPQNRSITFIADTIKFHTKDEDGLRWNKLSFNNKATKYTEPGFLSYKEDDFHSLYRGVDEFLIDDKADNNS